MREEKRREEKPRIEGKSEGLRGGVNGLMASSHDPADTNYSIRQLPGTMVTNMPVLGVTSSGQTPPIYPTAKCIAYKYLYTGTLYVYLGLLCESTRISC